MPILDDIMDHAVLGPKYREGREEGGRQVLRGLIEKRFGPIPDWAKHRLDAMSITEIETAALRLLDAVNLRDLFA